MKNKNERHHHCQPSSEGLGDHWRHTQRDRHTDTHTDTQKTHIHTQTHRHIHTRVCERDGRARKGEERTREITLMMYVQIYRKS